jgi:predicted NUDIX family NTP pyrophosphohydrolase
MTSSSLLMLNNSNHFPFQGTRPTALSRIKQPGGKIVKAWAMEGDFDAATLRSNTFTMEWPPKSGRMQEFAEVDRGAWFSLEAAREKLLKAQVAFLDQLAAISSRPSSPRVP